MNSYEYPDLNVHLFNPLALEIVSLEKLSSRTPYKSKHLTNASCDASIKESLRHHNQNVFWSDLEFITMLLLTGLLIAENA